MDEMMGMMTCLEKYDQNQAMCDKEIKSFQKCYDTFKAQEMAQKLTGGAQLNSSKIPVGAKQAMSGQQITQYMRQFPDSKRTKQWYVEGLGYKRQT